MPSTGSLPPSPPPLPYSSRPVQPSFLAAFLLASRPQVHHLPGHSRLLLPHRTKDQAPAAAVVG